MPSTRSPQSQLRRAFVVSALEALALPTDDVGALLALVAQVRVPDMGRGDLALPCFDLGKRVKLAPPEAAKRLAEKLRANPAYERVDAVGPYVNAVLAASVLAHAVVPAARAQGYGKDDDGAGKTVVLDFSSPNIAKPLAFHHIRSTVIGAAVARLHAARGWRVVSLNYLGDWGKQFGLLASAWKRLGDPARRTDAKHLVEVYVEANREADVDRLRAAIAAPVETRALLAELDAARALLAASADVAARKKLEGRLKTLQRRAPEGTPAAVAAHLADLDQAARRAAEELPAAEQRDREARLHLKRMEEGDEAALADWRELRETSIADFLRIYRRMGIEFSSLEGESLYTGVLAATVAKVAEKPGVRRDDGALVVDMPEVPGEPPVLLETRDGTTLYVTRDIAAAIDRHERFGFERSLYVIAQDQALHVRQLKRTLTAMGHAFAEKMTHVAFGRIHGMSTRRGTVVFLDEVLDEAVAKARELCAKSDALDPARREETAEAIGIGAVVFGDLKNLRASDYTFDLAQILDFDGLTGPYVQFTHARLASILRKGGGAPETADLSLLCAAEERAVMLALARFPDAVADACDAFEPSILTRSVLDLAQATSSWLSSGNQDRGKRVLVDDPGLRAARLQLVSAVHATLATGLGILGLRAPDAM